MPHVLWELQGQQRAVFAEEKDPHDPAKTVHVFKGFEQITPGTMTQAEYNSAVADLVAFLQWMGEPMRNSGCAWACGCCSSWRVHVIAWRLNAAFWKDIK
jgi:ubiquinol-cytochrome c reductase cytochrome c1 subunit